MKRYYIESKENPLSTIIILSRVTDNADKPDLCMAIEITPDINKNGAFLIPIYVDLYPEWKEPTTRQYEISAIEFNLYARMFNDGVNYEKESESDKDTPDNIHNGQIKSAFVLEYKRIIANAIQLFYLMISTMGEEIRKTKFGKSVLLKRYSNVEELDI